MCKVQDRVNELMAQAKCTTKVTVTTDLVGRCAGQCDGYGRKVRINKMLLESRFQKELDETIIHEVAHAVDIQRNGYRRDSRGRAIHHDQVFYDICAELGHPGATRTHKIKELKPTRKYRQFKYKLSNGEVNTLTTIRHNRLQSGKVEYYQWKGGVTTYKHDFIGEVI